VTRAKLLLWFVIAVSLGMVAYAATMRSSAPNGSGIVARLTAPGPLSNAHRTLSCSSCHAPVAGVEPKACLTCHVGTDFGNKQSTQFHAAAKDCASCHVEHEGDNGIIRMDHRGLLDPALLKRDIPQISRVHPRLTPEANLNCASCHSIQDPHLGVFGKDCASCHRTETWKVAGYRHPSPNSTQCSECHKAPPSHFMEHFSMVSQRAAQSKARVDQCYACHTTDSFNNIRSRGWYDHH